MEHPGNVRRPARNLRALAHIGPGLCLASVHRISLVNHLGEDRHDEWRLRDGLGKPVGTADEMQVEVLQVIHEVDGGPCRRRGNCHEHARIDPRAPSGALGDRMQCLAQRLYEARAVRM